MYHKTKNWQTMLIAQMDNDHLVNTINLIIKQIKDWQEILESWFSKSNLDAILSWYTSPKLKEKAEDVIKRNLKNLPYYIFEATIRWISYTNELQWLFARESWLGKDNLYLWNNYDDNDDDYDYDYYD